MKSLADYILIVDDVMPQHVIDDLLKEYETSNAWMNYVAGKSGGNSPGTHILISHPAIIQNSPSRTKILEEVQRYILEAFDQYHKKYSKRDQGLNHLMIRQLVGLRIIRYEAGQSLDMHTDRYTDPGTNLELWPVVTFTLNLNENYSGGELDLLEGDHIFQAKAGRCVFFPANFLYPHAVYPVRRGVRYSLVGWFL